MARWIVEIAGDRFDTEEIPYWFPAGEVFGISEDGRVYLTGPAFANCGSADAAMKIATQALEDFSAVISVVSPNFIKPETGTIIHEDDAGRRDITVVPGTGHARGRAKAHGRLSIAGQDEPQETTAQAFLLKARERPHLMTAALLWAEGDRTWGRLYRILEEIEADLGTAVNRVAFCSRNDRQRFTQSANSAEVAGRHARHAGKRFQLSDQPMTLRDAATFIHLLLQKVLQR
jgi:hypothetical protein